MTDPINQTKTCPDCAEEVAVAANVCRHCGMRFDGQIRQQPKSTAAAAVLSLILPGLGQLYLGRTTGGARLMISAIGIIVLLVLGLSMGALGGVLAILAILGVIVWLWGIIDAITRSPAQSR